MSSQKDNILRSIYAIYEMYKKGYLGGKILPEDSNPGLSKSSIDNYNFFTLTVALDYQRNAFSLWESAKKTFLDPSTVQVFDPKLVINMSNEKLKKYLCEYNLALQPNKHTEIWRKICETMCFLFDVDIRNLFIETKWYIPDILKLVQVTHKSSFPYLSGIKLCSYWLHILEKYTDATFNGREFLSIAPDTHIIKATHKLGLISADMLKDNKIQLLVAEIWSDLLKETNLTPIDMHTPLWLWSKSKFIDIERR
ncbi:hypothetical protein [Clostridium folliculivorans]|uniref:hypothetical protein n=1 Tax=Clostridium folliculivorans TaxID=2886038 RepID=UPI0021C2C708|nr:hypothetical protein [Clostridium folliculivorans]GKU30409.1 hypothetical protein CFB3_25160 [Clostridium folliculivorans]